MDGPLEASRNRDRDHYGGGGGGRHYGGGNYNRRGRGSYRGGRHRNNHHHPYGRNNYRGPRNNRNRYESEDPNAKLLRQLSGMISRIGDLKMISANMAPKDDDNVRTSSETKNIAELTNVVCRVTNIKTFLKFEAPPKEATEESFLDTNVPSPTPPPPKYAVKPQDQAGPFAHYLVSCAATLPLQTPCYAALTLAVQENSKTSVDYSGFASRCVTYAMHRLSYDLDLVLLGQIQGTDRAKITCRIKLLVRYLAILGKLNIVKGYDQDNDNTNNNNNGNDDVSSKHIDLTVLGLLKFLLEAATACSDQYGSHSPVPQLLAYLVLSTIPFVMDYIPLEVIQESLMEPLDALLASYRSPFRPGKGIMAILLKEEQMEPSNITGDDEEEQDDDDEEEEDDDDDDDDEEGASAQVCDTLQDLVRSVRLLLKTKESDSPKAAPKFELFSDAPWEGLKAPVPEPEVKTEQEEAMQVGESSQQEQEPKDPVEKKEQPMVFTGETLHLNFSETIKSLPALLNQGESTATLATLECVTFDGIAFGRLPMFGSPAESGDNDENDNDDEEDMEEAPLNEHIGAYADNFGIVDRYFLSDAVRDCLFCHESKITATGIERGNCKNVAEQVWGVTLIFPRDIQKGIEYGVIETLLSLIVQSSTTSAPNQIFLSRILLELTRLKPTMISPALAVAVSNLFQDYLPSMVPASRHALGSWFAFQLTNTDYQWPQGYWVLWGKYAKAASINSRGSFVKDALMIMTENLSRPEPLVKALPAESSLTNFLLKTASPPANGDKQNVPDELEQDMTRRMEDNEHADSLVAYLLSDEVSETLAAKTIKSGEEDDNNDTGSSSSDVDKMCVRTGVVIRSMLQPMVREQERLNIAIEQAQKSEGEDDADNSAMDEEPDSIDALSLFAESMSQYGKVLSSAISKDKEALEGSDKEKECYFGPFVLRQVDLQCGYMRVLVEGCLDCLLQNKVVLAMDVFRWILGEVGDHPLEAAALVVDRWWEIGSHAIREEISLQVSKAKESSSSSSGSAVMMIDRGEDSMEDAETQQEEDLASSKVATILEAIAPLLDYAVRRVCTLLSGTSGNSAGESTAPPSSTISTPSTKMTHQQVILLEGVKHCVRATHSLLFSLLKKSVYNEHGVKFSIIADGIAKSSVSGRKLADVCQEFQEGGSAAVVLLQQSLEGIN